MPLEHDTEPQSRARAVVSQRSSSRTQRGRYGWRGLVVAVALGAALSGRVVASAQSVEPVADDSLPSASLLSTDGARATERALDSAIHDGVLGLGVVRLTLEPQLDLSAEQLAVSCDGETPQCLGTIARQSRVQVLIAPILRRDAHGLVLSLLAFDTRSGGAGTLRRVTRSQADQEVTPRTLDQVPDALRELFGLPAAAAPASEARDHPARLPTTSATTGASPPAEPRAADSRAAAGASLLAPALLAGSGALMIAGGATAGLIMQHSQHDYSKRLVLSERDADRSASQATAGKRQALVANVLFAVGGVAALAGAVWLATTLARTGSAEQRPQTAMVPMLGRGQLGITLVHRTRSL